MRELHVALTFDAEHPCAAQCPPGVEEHLVDLLEREGVRATFFMQGRWATAHPETARRIADPRLGHLLGSHSEQHARLTQLTDPGLRDDIAEAERNIRTVTGVDPRPWFRCPFNDGVDDPRVLAALARAGYRNVSWDVSVSDWKDGRTARWVEDGVVDAVLSEGADTCIVLLHSWPAQTLGALPGIVARLRDAGAAFVTVAEVLVEVAALNRIEELSIAGEIDEAHRRLLAWLAEAPQLIADPWVRSRLREVIPRRALASDSPVRTTRSMCAELKHLGGEGSFRNRRETKALLADLWTAVALGLASGNRRDDRKAASAASRAILEDPWKPLTRPGLLRLWARAGDPRRLIGIGRSTRTPEPCARRTTSHRPGMTQ